MYRALTWLALSRGIGLEDEATLNKLATEVNIEIASSAEGGYNSVLVNGFNATAEIHSARVEAGVSQVAMEYRMPEAAYTAGILDGEGAITIHRNTGQGRTKILCYDLRVIIVNSCHELLLAIHQDYRGSLTKTYPKNRQIVYRLVFGGAEALYLLTDTLPFLIVKKEQAELALTFPLISPGNRSNSKYSEIRSRQAIIYERMNELHRINGAKGRKATQYDGLHV